MNKELYLFNESNYKYHYNNAIKIYCTILQNRNTTRLDPNMILTEIYAIADLLAQEWVDREKESKK
jgi:hypothetical protein